MSNITASLFILAYFFQHGDTMSPWRYYILNASNKLEEQSHGVIVQESCSVKFTRKHLPWIFFSKVVCLGLQVLIKKDSMAGVFL